MKLNSTIIYVKLLTTPFAQLKYESVDLSMSSSAMERNDPRRNGFGLDGSTFHVHVLLYEIRMDVLHELKRVRLVRLPR